MTWWQNPELVWIGILVCVTQSAMFSGLNLAFFSLNRLELEVAADGGNLAAKKVLAIREDTNFLLTTILWGNVGINVLLALLSNSVLAGFAAFLFSTVFITIFGEILPQAYFSRHALTMASWFAPALKFYQFLLYPAAKPCALLLDMWLGREGIAYYREGDLKQVIEKHVEADEAELPLLEGRGALNFLTIDDLPIIEEGEPVDPLSIVQLPVHLDLPIFPPNDGTVNDPFLRKIQASGRKWVILTNDQSEPLLVLDADGFLRACLFENRVGSQIDKSESEANLQSTIDPYQYCHRPIVIRDPAVPLGDIVEKLKQSSEHLGDDVIDDDIVLFWAEQRKVITGADILGRLLDGIGGPP